MDRILALVILLFTAPVFAASSTVVYPNFGGLTQTTVGGQTISGAKTGATVLSNGTVKFPFAGRLYAGLDASKAAAVGKAITARATIDQAASKILASQSLRLLVGGGIVGILGPWALSEGLQYLNGLWSKPGSTMNIGGQDYTYSSDGTAQWLVVGQNINNPPAPGYVVWCSGNGSQNPLPGVCGPLAGQVINSPYTLFRADSSVSQPASISPLPATQADFDDLAANGRNLSQGELQALIDAGWVAPLTVPISSPQSGPTVVVGDLSGLTGAELADLTAMGFFQPSPGVGAVPVGDPVTDPVTGQKTQPMVQLEPAPNAGVRITPYEQPLNPDGSPALDPQGNPQPNQTRDADPCELDPSRAGCATLGELNDQPPTPDVTNVAITPQTNWGGSGQCPSPANLSFLGQPIAFEFTPACTFFSAMQPVVIAAAWVASILIFIGGVKGQGA